jgi:cytochrome oxidase Cu insertion factor (SCO1/SenC/PrrC family)
MYSKLIILSLSSLLLLAACTQEEQRTVPPICRDYQVTARKVGSQTVHDTVYHALPDFVLVNQNDKPVPAASTRGTLQVVSFFSIMGSGESDIKQMQMLQLYREWKKWPDVHFLSFSQRPDQDTVEKLRQYASPKGIQAPRWQLLTGSPVTLSALETTLFRPALDSTLAEHAVERDLILLDRQGRVRGYYQANSLTALRQLATDVDLLRQSL